MQKKAGTSMSVPIDITDDTLASSLVPVQCASLAPPALVFRLERERTEGRKREKFYIYLDVTHTHQKKTLEYTATVLAS